ncbi:DUF423 domain-containing protein [Jiulongibacter sediminis]|nr:DUF423 domain-containing protein [Jiulongibacter sediminis]
MMINKNFLKTGAIFGLLAVALGAFGAHALEPHLIATGHLDTYEKAVSYQFYHSLALILVAMLFEVLKNKWIKYSGIAFIIGVIFFSGSLYLICFTGITTFGAVAPVGGTAFIAGWLFLFLATFKS